MGRWSELESERADSRSSQTSAWVSPEEGQNLGKTCWGKSLGQKLERKHFYLKVSGVLKDTSRYIN